MARPRLLVIIGSTRPGRIGEPIARWLAEIATAHGAFDVEVADLLSVNLPMFDEPNHPRSRAYVHEHTQRWSATVERSDAVVFVVPEYNHGYNAATKNAIDYLHHEWRDKSVGFVSYGGVSAGTRAVQGLRHVFLALKALPILESVNIPAVNTLIDERGGFLPPGGLDVAAHQMLDELARREPALRALRTSGS